MVFEPLYIGFGLLVAFFGFVALNALNAVCRESKFEKMTNRPSPLVRKRQLIILSGISGSGKTTIGKELARRKGYVYIDQDSYYRRVKPKITLSDGTEASNWDCGEALDLESMRDELHNNLDVAPGVVFAAFAPLDFWIDIDGLRAKGVNIKHLHLATTEHGGSVSRWSELVLTRCQGSRISSKRLTTTAQIEKDRLMVLEVVYPFYLTNQRHYHVDAVIDVYDQDGVRKTVDGVAQSIDTFTSS